MAFKFSSVLHSVPSNIKIVPRRLNPKTYCYWRLRASWDTFWENVTLGLSLHGGHLVNNFSLENCDRHRLK